MRMNSLVVLVLLLGCKGKNNEKPAEPPPATPTGSGSATAASPGSAAGSSATASCAGDLKPWIASLMDPAQTVKAPWPTGDAEFDKELPKLRDEVRAAAKPVDPAKRVEKLSPTIKPGRLDQELDSCAPAKAQIKKVSEAAPDHAAAAWADLADAIAACDCKPNIPRVKALLYLMQRGPD